MAFTANVVLTKGTTVLPLLCTSLDIDVRPNIDDSSLPSPGDPDHGTYVIDLGDWFTGVTVLGRVAGIAKVKALRDQLLLLHNAAASTIVMTIGDQASPTWTFTVALATGELTWTNISGDYYHGDWGWQMTLAVLSGIS